MSSNEPPQLNLLVLLESEVLRELLNLDLLNQMESDGLDTLDPILLNLVANIIAAPISSLFKPLFMAIVSP